MGSRSREVKGSWNQEVRKSQIVLWIANVIRVRVRVSAEISQGKHQVLGKLCCVNFNEMIRICNQAEMLIMGEVITTSGFFISHLGGLKHSHWT